MAKEYRRGGPEGPRTQERSPSTKGPDREEETAELGNQLLGELAAQHADSATDSGSTVGSGPVADAWRTATEGPSGNLPHQDRLETTFGVSLDDVEAYFGQGEAMERMGGHAGQAGNQVVFAEDAPPFERAAEEVAHVLQGRGSSGPRTEGTSRTSDPAETEAKHAASQAVSGTAPVLGAKPQAAVHLDADDSVADARRRALEIKDAFHGSWWSEDEERALSQIRGQSPLMIREIRAQYAEVTDGGSLETDFREYCNSDQYTEALSLLWTELPLLDRLKTNVEPGWLWDSANETGILDVLRSSSEAELSAAASDAAVDTLLRNNLDDDEYFEAARMLDPSRTYDLVVERIRSANGWLNDDEGAVYDAVLELSVDQRRRLWEDHQDDLFGFLSGDERERVRRMLLGSEADALQERMGAATEGLGTDDDAVAAIAERVQSASQEQAAIEQALSTGQGADGQPLSAEQIASLQTRLEELGGVSDLTRVERDADGDLAEGSFMGQLHGDVSDAEFQAFSQQMGASGFDRAKQQILDAVGLLNDDEQAIYDAFDAVVADVQIPEGTSSAVAASMQERANRELRQQLWNDPQVLEALSHLNVEELDIAATYRDADTYEAALQRLTDAYEGWNTDEEGIFRVITGMSSADRQRVLDERPAIYQRMVSSMDSEEVALIETALRDGRLPPNAALDYAMGGSWDGTREDLIVETFQGMSHDERYLYRLGYWLDSTGRDPVDAVQQGALERFRSMKDRLDGELGTDDLQRALDAMVGMPTPQELETEQGRVMAGDILRERMGDKQDVSGGLADVFTETDESRDQASAQLEAQYQLAIADGLISADELAVLAALDATYQERYTENVQAAEQIAGIASTVAAIAAGIVVTVLSGGTAGPAVAGFLAQYGAAAAIGGVAGAAAKVGTQELMAGDHYDAASTDGLRDAALGFTDGAMTVLSAGLAARFTSMVGLQRSALAAQMTAGVTESTGGALAYAGRAAVRTGVQSSIEGFLAGAVGEVVMTAADEATWRRSVWGVVAEMGGAILRGGGIGAATGFVAGSAMDALGGFVEARRVPALVNGLEEAGVDGDRLRSLSMRSLQQIGEADAALAAGKVDEAEELFRRLSATLDSGEVARIRRVLAQQHGVDLATDAAEGRVAQLAGESAFADSGFHGSSSAMLDGLEQTDGVIYSAEDLHRRSVTQVTGEGDAFSGASGRKSFISIGMGESGFGTSLAYADAAQNLNHYNVQRYTYDELTHEVDRLRTIVDNFDDIDVQVGAGSPLGMYGTKDKAQFASQLEKLQAELDLRDMLPTGHPRRIGGTGNTEAYPVLFEFDLDGLATRARPDVQEGGMLGGEGMADDAIDLNQRISRAYAPEANLEEFRARLENILGHSNFEVLPIEALGALPQGASTSSRQATFDGLSGLQRNFEEIQRMYEQAVRDGTPIDANAIMQMLQRVQS